MKLTILGTGNAKVTKCYNTCFALNEDKEYFMIDGGGGSTILKQLEDAGINWKDISTIFVTHKHIDHLLRNHMDASYVFCREWHEVSLTVK